MTDSQEVDAVDDDSGSARPRAARLRLVETTPQDDDRPPPAADENWTILAW